MNARAWLDRWGDWLLALALTISVELELWGHSSGLVATGGRIPLAFLVAIPTGSLAWRRRAPIAVLAVMTGTIAVIGFLVSHPNGLPVELFIAPIVAFYSVGANCDERIGLIASGSAIAAIALARLLQDAVEGHSGARPGAWLVFGVAWLVGHDLRRRRRELGGLRDQARTLEIEREERARAAVAEERGRIARELHDVVAHSVSVMVVQAQAGPRLLDKPLEARAAFRSIEASGREALVELRRLLGVLRTGDEQLAIGPQPGLGSLDSLVEQLREAGLPVALRIEGDPVQLPPGVDLSAYRIVQEALTNTLKHAGPAEALVTIRYGTSLLELEVSDNGVGTVASVNGSGHGLIGMRERVALYGGELEAGRRNDGGYAVRAQLPLGGRTL
jgi:signal transduction histidine kinase